LAKKSLTDIVALLEDDTHIKKVTEKHEAARETYKIGKRKLGTYTELLAETKSYIQHHAKAVDGVAMDDHTANSEALNFLVNYGAQILGKNANEVESDEAIEAVLKEAGKGKVADLLDFYKKNKISQAETTYSQGIIAEHTDPTDHKHMTSLARDYINTYANLLPKYLLGFPQIALLLQP